MNSSIYDPSQAVPRAHYAHLRDGFLPQIWVNNEVVWEGEDRYETREGAIEAGLQRIQSRWTEVFA